jgi:outer membrane protein assembly factor BamB
MTVSDGVLFVGHSLTPDKAFLGYFPTEHAFATYDAATGRPLWQDNTPTSTSVSWALTPLFTPLSANGAVYLLGLSAEPEGLKIFTCPFFCSGVAWLYAVNIRNGVPWWRISVGTADITHPIPG